MVENSFCKKEGSPVVGDRINVKDLTLAGLERLLTGMGAERYRAGQVAIWVFQKGAESFREMTNLPANLREKLDAAAVISRPEILAKKVSSKKDAVKYLFGLPDGQAVESVFMKHAYGNSVCVSTQAGCRMGCRFCASALGGLTRNLSPGEIYDQVLGIRRDTGERISSVVLMGSGEPLDNYDAALTFIKNVTAPYGLHIGCRHITVSTCGLVPGIRRLAREKLALTLAVSLHAPNDRLRDILVPVNRKYPLTELMAACRDYAQETGRRVTFEYALLAGVNDRKEHAEELVRLLKGKMPCHVNLIPANPVPERGVKTPSRLQVELFKKILERHGLAVTVRRGLGADIDAACGQLRRKIAVMGERLNTRG
ncbi:MAG: 23S rRNA (adenine(2503)-C(2))-methyltransferase RlmN [Pelotomaculum sp.]|nr:23S rRNA (adenine(2503)-C(2))-methyltransferase RlmN [Pelotomaculum sp.]